MVVWYSGDVLDDTLAISLVAIADSSKIPEFIDEERVQLPVSSWVKTESISRFPAPVGATGTTSRPVGISSGHESSD